MISDSNNWDTQIGYQKNFLILFNDNLENLFMNFNII